MKKITRFSVVGFVLLIVLSACQSRELSVEAAWARPGLAGENSAIYFVIHNPTDADEHLLSAQTDVATSAELHLSRMDENGNMSMEPQEVVDIPARGDVEFKAGSYHIMLVGLQQDLQPGDQVSLQLEFQNAGTVGVTAEVKEP